MDSILPALDNPNHASPSIPLLFPFVREHLCAKCPLTNPQSAPHTAVCLIPLYGLYPCHRAAEDILSMSSHEPYGATASCLRWFCLKKKKNTVCTRCFHSLRVVLDTKCCTAPALSCTRIPMRHTSLCDCRTLLLHRLPCINFTINLRK